MTLEVIDPESKEIVAPAYLVASKEMSWEQANKEFKGVELPCVHCWGYLQQKQQEARETLGLVIDDLASRFRKGRKTPQSRKWMHFAHRKGYKDKFLGKLPCHDPINQEHSVAVGCFRKLLYKEYGQRDDIRVIPEKRLIIKPGEPPITRRPDLVVMQNDQILQCAEIQRSSIPPADFIKRTQHLRSICPKVTWYIHKPLYNSQAFQSVRHWLRDHELEYFYYWIDSSSGGIEYLEGKTPKARKLSNKSPQSQQPSQHFCSALSELQEERQDDARGTNQQPGITLDPFSIPRYALDKALTNGSNQFKENHSSNQYQTADSPLEKTRNDLPPLSAAEAKPYTDYKKGDSVEIYIKTKWHLGRVLRISSPSPPTIELDNFINGSNRFSPISARYLRSSSQEKIIETSEQYTLNLFDLN